MPQMSIPNVTCVFTEHQFPSHRSEAPNIVVAHTNDDLAVLKSVVSASGWRCSSDEGTFSMRLAIVVWLSS